MTEATKTPEVAPKATPRKNVGTPGLAPKSAAPTNVDPAAETPTTERGKLPATGPVAFYVDGRRVSETQHKLNYMAGYTLGPIYENGAPTGRRTGPEMIRVTTPALTAAILAATGTETEADLYRTEWRFVLPQTGRTIETRRIEGREGFAEAEAPKAKPRRSRSSAPKAAPKPKAATA